MVVGVVEALGVVANAVAIVLAARNTRGSSVTALVPEVIVYLIIAVLLALLAWGLHKRRAAARTPFLLAQVFVLIIGYTVVVGDGAATKVVGALILVLGAVGLGVALMPSLAAELRDGQS